MTRAMILVWSIVVAVLAIVVVVDRPRRLDPIAAERLMPEGLAGQLRSLELERADGTRTQLARDSKNVLVLTTPALPTDAARVRDLVGALEILAGRRREPAADAAARGLVTPRLVVTATLLSGRRIVVRVGATIAATSRTWVDLGDGQHALVDAYAIREIDLTSDDLRRHEPFIIDDDRLDAAGVELDAGDAHLALAADPPRVAVGDGSALADTGHVMGLIGTLRKLRVQRFIDAPSPPPTAPTLTVHARGATLLAFGTCPGFADETLVESSLGWGCMTAGVLDVLADAPRVPTDWVDRALLPDTPRGLAKVELSGGAEHLVLIGPDNWRRQGPGAPVDDNAITDWFRSLAAANAVDVVVAPPLASPPLGAVVVHFHRVRGNDVVMWIDGHEGGRTWMQRAGEPVKLAFTADLGDLLRPTPWLFAPRTLVPIDSTRFAKLTIKRGVTIEVVERGASLTDVRVTSPVTLPVDEDAWTRLTDALGDARALRFVAASPRTSDGLTPPRFVVTLHADAAPVAGSVTDLVLDVGALRPDGTCFGRVGQGAVALLAAPLCAALATPLATTTLWSEDHSVIDLVVDGARLTRSGDGWRDAHDVPLPAVRAAEIDAVVRALAAPEVIGYGDFPSSAHGIVIALDDGTVLRLHAQAGEIALEGRSVRQRLPAAACGLWPALCATR